jgi:membrane-bound metal-dependent hydrolase YbcI (DUF457 family)
MGRSHLVSGTAGFVGLTYVYDFSWDQIITGLVFVSCAALLPDIDHRKATISRTYGPISVGFSVLVSTLAGGHRRGTHCLLGVTLMTFLAQMGVDARKSINWAGVYGLSAGPLFSLFWIFILAMLMILSLAAGIRIFRIPGWIDDIAPIPVVIFLVFATDISLDAVPPALALGCLIHIAGDCLTNTGCPIFLPLSQARLKVALFRTNGRMERFVVLPLMIIGILVMSIGKLFHAGVL